MAAIQDITLRRINGTETSLKEYTGKVVMIVNVASKCGLTPQYDALEKLYEKYAEKGLVVLGFPANEFGAQEPGTNSEIQDFCKLTYGVKFPMFEKVVVKGPGQHELYQNLTSTLPTATKKPGSGFEDKLKQHGLLNGKPGEITWNFEKFLISRAGKLVARYAPDVEPLDAMIVGTIEKELQAK